MRPGRGRLRAAGLGIGVVVALMVMFGSVGVASHAAPVALTPAPSVHTVNQVFSGHCEAAGTTGLNASVVAHSFETITGIINATGCDIGIYVPPGSILVTIVGSTIQGANDHGIFVQDSAAVLIRGNLVVHNGLAPHTCAANQTSGCISEDKAIELVGTSGSVVASNLVQGNMADGGIGIADDGPIDPGALLPGALLPATGNIVEHNSVVDNAFGCGIVVASYDAGAGVYYNGVFNNQVVGSVPGTGPFVGGIVVAADTPGTVAAHNVVSGNLINGSVIPGVVIHSNAPGDLVWGNVVSFNFIQLNGFEGPPNDPVMPTGIEVVAEVFPGEPSPPLLLGTLVVNNAIHGNAIGIWLCQDVGTIGTGTSGNSTVPLAHC